MDTTSLIAHRSQIASLGKDLFRVCEIEFEETSELQRQICGAFLFGVLFAYCKANQLTPSNVQALAICMLEDVLKYSSGQAGAFSSRLIQAASTRDPNDTHNAIIHRGIDGYHQLASGNEAGLRENLFGILNTLNAPYPPQVS